ncbi:hypothetical protein BDF20DRAFT_917810 [Mycotypha africana]|uniref:uncharacterized protein n=1 Tax=Mycotypha africana TaxID=64632 RepID=UPI002300721E|nr:uncharacterized protein BDF20DRAFT_917810 [Mycotypha africana]KAI8967144.1 hypothetical protein BDF20DRAFT_917810 [Mycotypha africana]
MTLAAVRVGLRVRPLTQKEALENCTECITYIPNEPQILLGTDKSFTFDYVFHPTTEQLHLYTQAAVPLLEKFLEGFNATILAYGQTGSGKTYSMGTGLESSVMDRKQDEGIVPRCITDLFKRLEERSKNEPEFQYKVYVSFLELYNEDLIDLLSLQQQPTSSIAMKRTSLTMPTIADISIREDHAGNIYWTGVREERCYRPEELLAYLAKGSLCRTTASTDMNTVSSRSHAVFSITLKQFMSHPESTTLASKFHFVDLAGSERLKRTHAQGDRAKEGIAINSGLLALGNVISALGDDTRRSSHIPYRDSKLTRLLQDSLGGNSQTLMLACVSPADTNFMETLNTLKYANRAKNIKNKVSIQQEFAGSSMEVNQLRAHIARLKLELAASRRSSRSTAVSDASSTVVTTTTDPPSHQERDIRSLRSEIAHLRERLQEVSTELIHVTSERDTLLMEREINDLSKNEPTSSLHAHPLMQHYQKTVTDLQQELLDARARIASYETTAPYAPTASKQASQNKQSSHKKAAHRRSKRHIMAASSHPTTRRSARKQHQDQAFALEEEDIRSSIAKAKAEIQKGMQVLDLVKPLEAQPDVDSDHQHPMQRDDSDEGNYTATSSPVDNHPPPPGRPAKVEDEECIEIEALSIPTWEQDQEVPHRITSQENLNSNPTTTSTSPTTRSHPRDHHPQWARILHQLQSDIRVKEELVSHLEKSETKYILLRRQFDEEISLLHQQVAQLQKDRDRALAKTKSAYAATAPATASEAARHELQLQEKQQLLETRHAFELKIKQLVSEIHQVKRNYSRTVALMQSTSSQQASLLKSLRANVDTLKAEKKRMIHRMKQETERVREQMAMQERRMAKLQRQHTEVTHARSRLQKEHEAQKLVLKRRDKERLIHHNQLTQLIDVLKKAVREGGMLDDTLLSQISHILGGQFAAVVRRGKGQSHPSLPAWRSTRRKKKNPVPVQWRVMRKKQLLIKLLDQFVQGKQAVIEMEQLLFRREQLVAEKMEVLDERKNVYDVEKETSHLTGEPMDRLAMDLDDERIDLIEAEIAYLSARIRHLQSEAAADAAVSVQEEAASIVSSSTSEAAHAAAACDKRKVTFADDIIAETHPQDEWADMDAIEEQYGVPANAAPELVYDGTLQLLKSLEMDECRYMVESLVDDLANAHMSDLHHQRTMQNLEKTVQDLRKTLMIMKRAAISTTAENERRIRTLEAAVKGTSSSSSLHHKRLDEDDGTGDTIFDRIYADGVRGLLETPEPRPSLYRSPEEAAAMAMSDRRSSTHSEGLMPPPSPLTLTPSLLTHAARPSTHQPVHPPSVLTEKGNRMMRVNSDGSYRTRQSTTPSPDRFYNMIQKRLSWQHRMAHHSSTSTSRHPEHDPPPEFARYVYDRESSTSSIRSSHFRRPSLQSDHSSSQSSWAGHGGANYQQPPHDATYDHSQQQKAERRRSLMILPKSSPLQQQQQQKTKRRASLRELSIQGIAGSPMGYYDPSPSLTLSQQPLPNVKRTFLLPSASSTVERASTPNGANVFHRLAQTPTRASQAKINFRHSSSSMDELKTRWCSTMSSAGAAGAGDLDRIPSAASGIYHGDA